MRRGLALAGGAVAAVVVAAVLLLGSGEESSGPSPASGPPLVGANLHLFFRAPLIAHGERELSAADGVRMVDEAADAGAQLIRVAVQWPLLEPADGRPQREYAAFVDRVLRRAGSRRLGVVVVWGGVPCGQGAAPRPEPQCRTAQGRLVGSAYYPEAPAAVRAYADAAARFAARYRRVVVALEPGNEPNNPQFLHNPGGPAVYARVLRATHAAVRRRAPHVDVLAGALALSDAPYLQRLYDTGIRGSYEGISIHPYDVRFAGPARGFGSPLQPAAGAGLASSFWSGLAAIRVVMRRNGDAGTPLWLTEFGYRACGGATDVCVGERRQASWLRDALLVAAARGAGVHAALIYLWRDYADDFGGRFGLEERSGRRRPSLAAVSAVWHDLRADRLRTAALHTPAGLPVAVLTIRRAGDMVEARVLAPPASPALRLCLETGGPRRCSTGAGPGLRARSRAAAVATLAGAGGRVLARLPAEGG